MFVTTRPQPSTSPTLLPPPRTLLDPRRRTLRRPPTLPRPRRTPRPRPSYTAPTPASYATPASTSYAAPATYAAPAHSTYVAAAPALPSDSFNSTVPVEYLHLQLSRLGRRGSSECMYDTDSRAFPRFRLVEIGRNNRDLMDFGDPMCAKDRPATRWKPGYPRRPMICTGTSMSSTPAGTLSRGSSKRPIPVLANTSTTGSTRSSTISRCWPVAGLSDLVEKPEWAIAHDTEAHALQQAG
ncbi:hypothetical protein DFH09DRAFT_1314698 [Mycena vulgaris]|nr:hypothetical protein DFH09DRAFT_1314698 [Mycena vulgaris]